MILTPAFDLLMMCGPGVVQLKYLGQLKFMSQRESQTLMKGKVLIKCIIRYLDWMRIKDTSTCYSFTISVCMGSVVFGYQLSSFGNLHDLILNFNFKLGEDTGNTMMLLSTLLALSAIFASLFYRWMIKTFGYVQTFKITDYLTIAAAVIGMLSLSVGLQAFSRILFGVVAGINTIQVPTYLTSLLPGSMGGPCGTLNQLFIVVGIFLGFLMGFIVTGDVVGDMGWRVIVGFPILPALIRLHTSQNVYPYESVENMIETGDDERLQSYLDIMYEQVTLEEYKEMKTLARIDKESEQATFFDPSGESYRRRLTVGCAIVFFNQLSGGAALGFFGGSVAFDSITKGSSEDTLQMFVYLNLLQIVVTLFAGQFNEKYGRRSFMMQGQRIIIVSLLLIAFIEIFVPSLHIFTVILIFIQMVGFSLSYGPCSFVLLTELMHDIWFPSMMLWIFIFIHGVSVGTFVEALGIGPLCLIYFILQIWGLLYISGYLVQTSGRSRQDVYADFRKGIFPNPIRYLREKLRTEGKEKVSDIEMELIDRQK